MAELKQGWHSPEAREKAAKTRRKNQRLKKLAKTAAQKKKDKSPPKPKRPYTRRGTKAADMAAAREFAAGVNMNMNPHMSPRMRAGNDNPTLHVRIPKGVKNLDLTINGMLVTLTVE